MPINGNSPVVGANNGLSRYRLDVWQCTDFLHVLVKLFVYGFSRGAAKARALINGLTEILDAALLKILDSVRRTQGDSLCC